MRRGRERAGEQGTRLVSSRSPAPVVDLAQSRRRPPPSAAAGSGNASERGRTRLTQSEAEGRPVAQPRGRDYRRASRSPSFGCSTRPCLQRPDRLPSTLPSLPELTSSDGHQRPSQVPDAHARAPLGGPVRLAAAAAAATLKPRGDSLSCSTSSRLTLVLASLF